MKFARLVGILAVAVVAGPGCVRDDGGVDREKLLAEMITAVCTSVQGCCNAASMDIDNQKCGDDVRFHIGQLTQDPALSYDAQHGKDCVEAARDSAASCVEIDYSSCIRAFDGNRPPGAPCSSAYNCALGPFGYAVCSSENQCVQPTRGRPNEPCSASCVEKPGGSTCTSLFQTPGIVQSACHSADGLTCRVGEGGQPTCQPLNGDCRERTDVQCIGGATCDQQTGVCVPPVLLGGACGGTSKCAAGGYCASGVCQPTKSVHAMCLESPECESGRCYNSLCVSFSKLASVMCLARPGS